MCPQKGNHLRVHACAGKVNE